MRLLETTTLQIREFHSDLPQYAILSHTWVDGEEVTFEDMVASSREEIQTKAGYHKILQSCSQAVSDKLEFIWVDTCCIDKRSSAELSEAINSMFRWYADAKVCYAYLPDVKDRERPEIEFANSRWFRRGWTLQELVAPSDIVFFGGEEWFRIGTKASLRDAISRITKIDISILSCSQDVFKASIAQRMSWASTRKTTRKEDLAYSLLGIFGVNMPLLYGEGDNAFVRLQLELLNLPNDHTVFAWGISEGNEVRELNPVTNGLYQRVYDYSPSSRVGRFGLLAPSVGEFSNCGNVKQSYENSSSSHYMTNIGLSITLPTILVRQRASIEYHAFLDCYHDRPTTDGGNPRRICLRLRYEGNSRFCRVSIGERSVRERNLWARMTPMFITRTRLDHQEIHSLPGSVVDPGTRPSDSRRSENHDESLNSSLVNQSWAKRWLVCALQEFWSSWGDREASDNETRPLLGDAERDIRDSPSSNHHAQGFGPSGQRFTSATRNILSFLATNGVCFLIIIFPLAVFTSVVVVDSAIVFVLDFLAIMALAPLLRNATKRLSATLGYTVGGLIDAFFGNAVEMIVNIAALRIGELRIIKRNIMGSITSNILLVLGTCFSVSGMLQLEQPINFTAANTMLSLMAVALASLMLPVASYYLLMDSYEDTEQAILNLSRGIAILLLLLFCVYLYFQQKSPVNSFAVEEHGGGNVGDPRKDLVLDPVTVVLTSLTILIITVGLAVCAHNLVSSIDSVAKTTYISKDFIGFVVLPVVGYTAGPATAVVAAYKGKLYLAIDVVIESLMQITVFVMPFVVIVGWIIEEPIELMFGVLETLCLFLGVFVVSLLIQGRKINYLGGFICVSTYFMISVTIYFSSGPMKGWLWLTD